MPGFGKISALITIAISFSLSGFAQEVEIRDKFFYVDGQKFYVKGIGYEYYSLPGQLPWNKVFQPEQLRFDIERIMAAGYNTIRTWTAFSDQELTLLDNYNIKIIMGIWIDPAGDFGNISFINNAKSIVSGVLSYSKKHKNIIAYLIMNEPLPENIFKASSGYDNTVELWKQLINIIHTQHPGRPVSIANTSVGTYIDPDIFDFSAYNIYIYNPVTANFLHGFRDFTAYLKKISKPDVPLVITEFGLSVSPSGPGNWDYGGNTLEQQKDGLLYMYKSQVDGGANGSCVFNYADGWWKGGDEFTHNDAAEEWFGLINYTSLTDTRGEERPAWKAISDYQSAIITQPASSEIYINKVPVEIFLNDTVKKIEVLLNNEEVYSKVPENTYISDTIDLTGPHMLDASLVFNCYNNLGTLIKSEVKNILVTDNSIILPSITFTTNNNFWKINVIKVTYTINKSPDFTTDPTLRYIYYPHHGWDYGLKYQASMPSGSPAIYTVTHSITASTQLITVGASFDITYNTFSKRIVNQETFRRMDYTGIPEDNYSSGSVEIYPNPAGRFIKVANNGIIQSNCFSYEIFNLSGIAVIKALCVSWDESINISSLNKGIYHMLIKTGINSAPFIKKLIVM